jgi:arginyl-tRNA synthetase
MPLGTPPNLQGVITGDLHAALRALAAPGRPWPAAPGRPWPAATWRPAPGGEPGGYATPLPFRLAKAHGGDSASIAAGLASQLRHLDWIAGAASTGRGYLTVTVTTHALTRLAVRIPQAGPACARSHALAGTTRTAPAPPDLASAPTWHRARQLLAASVVARLAQAAGAQVTAAAGNSTKRSAAANPPPTSKPTAVADAIAYAGADAIAYTLASLPAHAPAQVDAGFAAKHHLGNPAYAVRYAHAHAASTQRQAATFGLGLGEALRRPLNDGEGRAASVQGSELRLLAHPREQSLLYALSWLPERVAEGARRAQPDVLTRYLEAVADAYLGCQENCPAVPPGVPGTHPAAALTVARLCLAAAAATVLRTGLCLLGVTAPERL